MPVISTTRARHSPIAAPTTIAASSSAEPGPGMSRSTASAIVATRAMTMPAMPKVLPALAVSCLDSPARARMNSRAATMYAAWAAVSTVMRAQLLENMASMRRVTAKPPKTLMLASRTATRRAR